MGYRFARTIIATGCFGLVTVASSLSQEAPSSDPPAQNTAQAADQSTAPKSAASDQPGTAPKANSKPKGALPGKRRAKKALVPDGTIRKIVVRKGGVDEPSAQIVQGMTPEEAVRQRQNTEQLLNSTNEALQRLSTHPLDAQQQETVSQIRNYMNGARSALKENDLSRAWTLASKASLLGDDLEQHQPSALQ